jgi:hypothetical protein
MMVISIVGLVGALQCIFVTWNIILHILFGMRYPYIQFSYTHNICNSLVSTITYQKNNVK